MKKLRQIIEIANNYNLAIKTLDKADKLLQGKTKNCIIYQVQAPFGGYGIRRGASYFTIYLDDKGEVRYIDWTPYSRIHNFAKVMFDKKIDYFVKNNYLTGGYTTRWLLKSKNKNKKAERCSSIFQSHVECVKTGKEGHNIRVMMRN